MCTWKSKIDHISLNFLFFFILLVFIFNPASVSANMWYPTFPPPEVPEDQEISIDEDNSVDIILSTQPNNPFTTYLILTSPQNGTLSEPGTNVTYTPNPDFHGTDSFTYSISSMGAHSAIATTVTITVRPIDDPPIAENQSLSTDEDTSISFQLRVIDIDSPINASTQLKIKSPPANGSLSSAPLNKNYKTYKPHLNFNGADSFTFEIMNGLGQGAIGQVDIAVNSINDKPTANSSTVSIREDSSIELELAGSDVDGDNLTYVIMESPTNGAFTTSNSTYIPEPNFNGADELVYVANDGTQNSEPAIINITITPVPEQPQNLSATVESGQVRLTWDVVEDADRYMVCYANFGVTDPVNCAGESESTTNNNLTITGLINNTEYFFVVVAVADYNGSIVHSLPSAEVAAIPTPIGRLNDTGITLCGNSHTSGRNDIDCLNGHDSSVPIKQDALTGLDVSNNDSGDGHAGFSFTKVDGNGNDLTPDASTWSCVKDNITGLTWELKDQSSGPHNKNDTFSWYNTDSEKNGGDVGVDEPNAHQCNGYTPGDDYTSFCNTSAFVNRTNALGFCGANDWRLPTLEELRSIVNYGSLNPAIDTQYFPDMLTGVQSSFWSSNSTSASSDEAWSIDFGKGYHNNSKKHHLFSVRLVRDSEID